jgi:hypothetical protein
VNQQEIRDNVGAKVRLVNKGDEYVQFGEYMAPRDRTLEIVKLTLGGMALLKDDRGRQVQAPPRIVERVLE